MTNKQYKEKTLNDNNNDIDNELFGMKIKQKCSFGYYTSYKQQ